MKIKRPKRKGTLASLDEISGELGSSWLDVQRLSDLPPLLGSGSRLFGFCWGKNVRKNKFDQNKYVICYYFA